MKHTIYLNKRLEAHYRKIAVEVSKELGVDVSVGNVIRAVLRIGKTIPPSTIKEEVVKEPVYPSRKVKE